MKGKTAISPMEEEMIKLLLGKYSPAIASMITEESDVFVTLREVLRHLGSLPWGQRQLGLSQVG